MKVDLKIIDVPILMAYLKAMFFTSALILSYITFLFYFYLISFVFIFKKLNMFTIIYFLKDISMKSIINYIY